jgi:hypothetical protein
MTAVLSWSQPLPQTPGTISVVPVRSERGAQLIPHRTVTKTRYVDAITTEDVLRTFLTVKNTTETINVSVQKTDVIGTTSTQTIDVTATISVSETDTVYVDATATSISSIVSTSYKDEPATSTVDIMTTTTDYGIALTAVSVTSMITLTDVSGVTTVLATTVIDGIDLILFG